MLRAEAVKVGELGRIRVPKGALVGDRCVVGFPVENSSTIFPFGIPEQINSREENDVKSKSCWPRQIAPPSKCCNHRRVHSSWNSDFVVAADSKLTGMNQFENFPTGLPAVSRFLPRSHPSLPSHGHPAFPRPLHRVPPDLTCFPSIPPHLKFTPPPHLPGDETRPQHRNTAAHHAERRGRSLLAASGPLADPDGDSGSVAVGGGGMGAASTGGGWRVDIVGPKKKSSNKDKQKALPSSTSSSSSSSPSASGAIAWLNDIEVGTYP